jgi:hypothetical protein
VKRLFGFLKQSDSEKQRKYWIIYFQSPKTERWLTVIVQY